MKPFTFDRSFDDPANLLSDRDQSKAKAKEDEPPSPPSFSEAEMEAAKLAAFEDGRSAGAAEALAGIEQRVELLLQAVSAQLPGLDADQQQANAEMARLASVLAVTVARKVLPRYAETHGFEEVAAVVQDTVETLSDDARISVRMAPEMVAPVRARLAPVMAATGFESRVNLVEDPSLSGSDAVLSWGDGEARRELDSIWREVDAAAETILAHAFPEPPAPTEQSEPTESPAEPEPETTATDEPAAAPEADEAAEVAESPVKAEEPGTPEESAPEESAPEESAPEESGTPEEPEPTAADETGAAGAPDETGAPQDPPDAPSNEDPDSRALNAPEGGTNG